ncbi:MAG: hypothetical protein IPP54_03430 [Anaerolineales bacterium]|nr:hypothetical protein [Anaerolineales bacterium]
MGELILEVVYWWVLLGISLYTPSEFLFDLDRGFYCGSVSSENKTKMWKDSLSRNFGNYPRISSLSTYYVWDQDRQSNSVTSGFRIQHRAEMLKDLSVFFSGRALTAELERCGSYIFPYRLLIFLSVPYLLDIHSTNGQMEATGHVDLYFCSCLAVPDLIGT